MYDPIMAYFVLVPGAWLDASVFDAVCEQLADRGHSAKALTMPGIVEPTERKVTLGTWVDHVVNEVQQIAEAEVVVLVGHSFAGIVVGPASVRLGSVVERLVFVDANLPEPGRSFADSWSSSGQEWLANQIEQGLGYWPPDLEQDETGLSDADQATLLACAHPMPAGPLYDPAPNRVFPDGLRTSYIHCTIPRPVLPASVVSTAADCGWTIAEIAASHWPMVCSPSRLCDVLSAS